MRVFGETGSVPTAIVVPSELTARFIDFKNIRLRGLSAGNKVSFQDQKIAISKRFNGCRFLCFDQVKKVISGTGPITDNWKEVLKSGTVIVLFGEKIQSTSAPGVFYRTLTYSKRRFVCGTINARSLVKDGYVTAIMTP
jgi:hypothetical protein